MVETHAASGVCDALEVMFMKVESWMITPLNSAACSTFGTSVCGGRHASSVRVDR